MWYVYFAPANKKNGLYSQQCIIRLNELDVLNLQILMLQNDIVKSCSKLVKWSHNSASPSFRPDRCRNSASLSRVQCAPRRQHRVALCTRALLQPFFSLMLLITRIFNPLERLFQGWLCNQRVNLFATTIIQNCRFQEEKID